MDEGERTSGRRGVLKHGCSEGHEIEMVVVD